MCTGKWGVSEYYTGTNAWIYFPPFYSSFFQSCKCKYTITGLSTYFDTTDVFICSTLLCFIQVNICRLFGDSFRRCWMFSGSDGAKRPENCLFCTKLKRKRDAPSWPAVILKPVEKLVIIKSIFAVTDSGFLRRMALTLKDWRQPIIGKKFCRKTAWNWKKLAPVGRGGFLVPPCIRHWFEFFTISDCVRSDRSDTGHSYLLFISNIYRGIQF